MDQTKTRSPRWPYLWVAAIGIALAGAAVWYGTQGRRPRLKNVILISIDTLRADHLRYAGYERDTSPAIDRLAAQSLDFRQAYSQAPSTLPSHATMFTSVYPMVHQARVANRVPLAEGFSTLAEHFRHHGFRTAAFVEGGQMAAPWKLDQGFEVYDDVTRSAGFTYRDPQYLKEILQRATRWMERHRAERFFCFIHTYVVHLPYTPPPPYERMFDEDYQGPLPFQVTIKHTERLNETRRQPDEPDVRHLVSLYDGEIRYMDHCLGEFLDTLAELGIDDEAVLVFTSDHGEEFAEHGRVGMHGHTLADELLHVPLLIRIPGVAPQVIARQVRLVDLVPTLLSLMNLEPLDAPLQGENLVVDGVASGPDLPVLSQMASSLGAWASLRYGQRKILGLNGTEFFLYDLEQDPGEQHNVFGWHREDHLEMVKAIQGMMARNNEITSLLPPPVTLDPKTEDQLRALGYLN